MNVVPPAGWRAQPADPSAARDWIAPTGDAVLRAFAAVALAPVEVDPIAVLAARGSLDLVDGPHELVVARGALGTTWRLREGAVRCDLVVLRDARFEYALVLESRSERVQARDRPRLHACARSLVPRAPRQPAWREAATALAHWTQ